MTRRFSVSYIDKLLTGDDYGQLVELCSVICSNRVFSVDSPHFGLPIPIFAFVETLTWFAQAIRSGVWTYYEATPVHRQEVMLAGLRKYAPDEYADYYQRGMIDWSDELKIAAVDEWLKANDDGAQIWLRKLAIDNRELVIDLTG